MEIEVGSLVDERYRVLGLIGSGGMADVYEADDVITRKSVAIKLIREELMQNPANLRRFRNEATMAASLNHPNIVKVINNGTFEGRPFMIQEFIKGKTLKDILDTRQNLTYPEAVSVMIQLTAALSCSHSHGIIHRDIKPQNIFLLPDGTVKLGDFGIADTDSLKLADLGQKEDIVGSVHYLSPEMVTGKAITEQSDIYSAGITFFELITGHVPFTGKDSVAIAVKHVKEKMPSPNKYLSDCPKEIERIILKACSKRTKDRYQTSDEFHKDLVNLKNKPELMKEKRSLIAKIFGFK